MMVRQFVLLAAIGLGGFSCKSETESTVDAGLVPAKPNWLKGEWSTNVYCGDGQGKETLTLKITNVSDYRAKAGLFRLQGEVTRSKGDTTAVAVGGNYGWVMGTRVILGELDKSKDPADLFTFSGQSIDSNSKLKLNLKNHPTCADKSEIVLTK